MLRYLVMGVANPREGTATVASGNSGPVGEDRSKMTPEQRRAAELADRRERIDRLSRGAAP